MSAANGERLGQSESRDCRSAPHQTSSITTVVLVLATGASCAGGRSPRSFPWRRHVAVTPVETSAPDPFTRSLGRFVDRGRSTRVIFVAVTILTIDMSLAEHAFR